MSWESDDVAAAVAATPRGGSELGAFHQTLAEMCRADVPLPNALRMLAQDLEDPRFADSVQEMAAEVEEGVPLAAAYGPRAEHFPSTYRALIEAGTISGDLPGALDEIASHATFRARVTARIRSALAYPIATALFVVVIGFALALIAPTLDTVGLVRDLRLDTVVAMPSRTIILLAGIGVAFLLVFAALGCAWMRRPLDAGCGPRSLLFRLPMFGRVRNLAAKAEFASTMALLTRRAIPLPKALRLAAATTESPAVRTQVQHMAETAESGHGLADSIKSGDLISPSLIWLVQSAEPAGSTPDALREIARIYGQRLERAVERRAMLVQPIAQLLIGIVVFLYVLACVFPSIHFMNKVFGW